MPLSLFKRISSEKAKSPDVSFLHLILFGGLIFLLIWPAVLISARSQESYVIPYNFEEIENVSYRVSQSLNHWEEGSFEGNGTVLINFDHSVEDSLYVQIQYNESIWSKPCTTPNLLNDSVYMEVDKNTGEIVANSDPFFNLMLKGFHFPWWVSYDIYNHSLAQGNISLFYEDLLELHGERVDIELVPIPETFIFLNGEKIACYGFEWTGQLVYAGYICSIGLEPLFNCSLKYLYEKNTGILIYSETNIKEFLGNDPQIYQVHNIKRFIEEINGNSISFSDSQNSSRTDNEMTYPWQGDDKNKFIALISITAIIMFGLVSMFIINRMAGKRRLKELIEYEKEHGPIEDLIKKELAKKDEKS